MSNAIRRQLINVLHHNRAQYDERWFGRGQCVLFVEKVRFPDGRTVKRVVKNDKPTIRYYVTREEHRAAHKSPELAYEAAKCQEYESPLDDLFKHIAELTDQMPYYKETRGPGANRRRRALHSSRFLHGSDANVVDSYIDRFMEHYKDCLDTTSPLEMAFADIEVDIIEHVGFPEETEAPCPISLVSYFHAPTKRLTQFALRNSVRANPLQQALERSPEEHWCRVLAEVNRSPLEKPRKGAEGEKLPPLAEPGAPWLKLATLLGLADDGETQQSDEAVAAARCLDYELLFFDTELELMEAFLHRVNEVDRPDILAYWNMRFDIVTQMNRLRKLGVDPAEAFTPKDFGQWQLADYQVDTFNTEPTDCNDTFNATSYTIYVDQMLLYAALRKQAGKKESYSLDFTLRAELKENKFEYEGELRDLMYRNYSDFLLYGAIDVVPMATLEEKTEDIALAYQLSMTTRTRFHKIMKKTICLRNLANIFYRERGLVLSNNRNKLKERTSSEQFRGALVADPKLMDSTGILVGGQPSNRVFDDVVDFDATSLYPSIILSANIDANGQVGRLLVEGPGGELVESSLDVEAWACGDAVEIGRAWLGLPGLAELADAVLEGD